MERKIIIATHKEYKMPEDPCYLPVQAGSAIHPRLPYTGDDTGLNISGKNDLYCELTALYWGWKNLRSDVVGLCHYRRYFSEPGKKEILSGNTLQRIMTETPLILPAKRHYWIETGESQFVHAHGAVPLDTVKGVLSDLYPEYRNAFTRSLERTSGHRFNMFIMRREQLNQYCTWLFDILFETERRLPDRSPRIMGFLSERLLDAWVDTTETTCRELPVFYTEQENWIRKGSAFLWRKIRAKA